MRSFIAALVAGCHDHSVITQPDGLMNGVHPPPDGRAEFTVIPMDVPNGTLTPLGSLNPPGHVLPTDHVYFYPWNLDSRSGVGDTITRTVYAPTTGAVNFMIQPSGTDWKIQFAVTATFSYYVDHVTPRAGLKLGDVVRAGEIIGTALRGTTLDLGVIDSNVTNTGFARLARYPFSSIHCASPWKYFVEPLRSQLYARIRRVPGAPDKDGRIDFDIPGRLAGAWFDQSLADSASFGPAGWAKTVAFVYDYYDPSQVRISIGGTIGPAGVWAIEQSAPRPETVSAASGKVVYRLYSQFDPGFPSVGTLIVQMTGDAQIRVELFMGIGVTATEFDAQAKTFVR